MGYTLCNCRKPEQSANTNHLQRSEQGGAQYAQRGFRAVAIHADPECVPLQAAIGQIQFNCCAQNEHVPEIERFIWTVKDRARSRYNSLPYSCIPRLMTICLVSNAVFWLNAFPHRDGASSTLSLRYLLTGKHLDFDKHVRTEFGAYVQTHEQHLNDMHARTLGSICLGGPSGNEQGGHWFLHFPLENKFIVTNGPPCPYRMMLLPESPISPDNNPCRARSRLLTATVLKF
jgi:hypothetical protein